MAGIQVTGLASGMDTKGMIQKILEVERQPIYQKQMEIQKISNKKNEWVGIDKRVSNLTNSAKDLKFNSTFRSKLLTSSNPSKITGVAGSNAVDSNHVFENVRIAKPGIISSGLELPLTGKTNSKLVGFSSVDDPNQRFSQMQVYERLTSKYVNRERLEDYTKENGDPVTNWDLLDSNEIFLKKVDLEGGSFSINGERIAFSGNDTLNLVITKINRSDAKVKASYDNETKDFVLESEGPGSIRLGLTDRGGFLTSVGLKKEIGKITSNSKDEDFKAPIRDVEAFDNVSNGFFTINGNTFEVRKKDSLEEVIEEVNKANIGISMFYDDDTKRVTLTTQEPGEDLVLENDTSKFLRAVGLMNNKEDTNYTSGKSVYIGEDASFTMDGVYYRKPKNEFTISGVKVNLKADTKDNEAITVKVESDVEKAYKKIDEFVKKYNELVEYMEKRIGKNGTLQGDVIANGLLKNIRRRVSSNVSGVNSEVSQLALVGIKTEGKSGKLIVDTSKLKDALAKNPIEMNKLFSKGKDLEKVNVIGSGTGYEDSYILNDIPKKASSIVLKVGDKVYDTSGTRNKIFIAEDLEEKVADKILSGNIKNGEDLKKESRKFTKNDLLLNTETGEVIFGSPPAEDEAIILEYKSKRGASNDGIAVSIDKYLKPYTKYKGTLDSHLTSYDTKIRNITEWIADKTERIEMREDSLKKQFSAMESAMQTSNSQSKWLSGQLAGLR